MAAARRRRRRQARRGEESETIALPNVRSYQTWTPSLLRSAELSADNGNIRLAADICEWLLSDDKVRASLDGRIAAVFGQPLAFEESRQAGSSRLIKDLDDGGEYDAIFPENQTWLINAFGFLLGFAPYVHRWDIDEDFGGQDGHDVPRVEFFHPQPFRWDWQFREWRYRTSSGTEETASFGDGTWAAHFPFGEYRPWALGLWRALAPWVLLKHYARMDTGRLGETASRSVVESERTVPSVDELRKKLANEIIAMGREGAIVLPAGFSYKLVTTSAQVGDLYAKQNAMADTAIALTIRGSNLTTQIEGSSGSRAAAEVHERNDLANAKRDNSAWSTTSRKMTLVHWASRNYGDERLAPWPKYQTDPEEDRKAKSEVFGAVMKGVKDAQSLGFEVDRDGLIEEFEFRRFLKPGEVIQPRDPNEPTEPGDDEDGDGSPGADPPGPDDGTDDGPNPPQRPAGVLRAGPGPATENGQEYADRVKDEMTRHAAKALMPTVAAMLSEIERAENYDDARLRISQRYRDLASPRKLAELTEAAIVLTQEAGHLSAIEEAEG